MCLGQKVHNISEQCQMVQKQFMGQGEKKEQREGERKQMRQWVAKYTKKLEDKMETKVGLYIQYALL